MPNITVNLPVLHNDQVRAYLLKEDARAYDLSYHETERAAWAANRGGRFKAVRCGRRWGKTEFGKTWLSDGAAKGMECGWFAPDYKRLSEAYEEIRTCLEPITTRSNKTDGVIRTKTGGRVDFWTLEDESAGRSRKYRRVVVDEGAFTKANMMDIWKKSIKPTLFDYTGHAIVASNTNGVAEDNFMWQICNQPEHGFIEFHAPTINNPTIPQRLPGETLGEQTARRHEEIAKLKATEHPLVFLQEYEAEFVDWSGVAFFDIDKLLVDKVAVPYPNHCDAVFAIIDSASKTGTDNDGTGVIYAARNTYGGGPPLIVLDYDLQQIEGALLETWLPVVFQNLEALAAKCGARAGSLGVWIEDKSSGIVLLQQAMKKWPNQARAIDSKLTALGKDERAISASGYHYRGEIKMSAVAFNKVFKYKTVTRNHLLSQVSSFRIGDKDAAKRADDLLDCYTYMIAVALGNSGGF